MSVALVAAEPATVARATIAHHSKSFAMASRLLGARVRDQTAVIYTWCRRADDEVDEPGLSRRGSAAEWQRGVVDEPGLSRRGSAAEWQRGVVDEGHDPHALARLDRELTGAYAGTASDPVLAAFGAVSRERNIPIEYPRDLLAGMAMDVDATTYRTVEDVIAYAWRVAGVVGLMMTHVFGCADDGALVHAAHLGIAMQLTNISRDVAEDWQRGRLYLPAELLGGARDLAGDLGKPLPSSAHAAIAAATKDLLQLADRYYRSGDRGIAMLPFRAALAVRAARKIYAAIGDRIAHNDYSVTAGRAFVPTGQKLALVASASLRTMFKLPRSYSIPSVTLELANVPRC